MKMRIRSYRNFIILALCGFFIVYFLQNASQNANNSVNLQNWLESVKNLEKNCRDWHDYDFIARELKRVGPGEQGKFFNLTDPREIEENKILYAQTGMSVVISNKISVNRSMPDVRDVECQSFRYPADLPSVSVIIIFHNEVPSILKRTIHGVINRTPKELLHEVILVNDKSTDEELYEPLETYVKENFGDVVKIKKLKERKGLIVTRLEGAEIATGEILVFFE